MRPCLSTVLLALLIPCGSHAADSLWTQTFAEKINWQRLGSATELLVSTDDFLYGVDAIGGKILWQSEILGKLDSNMTQVIPEAALAMIELTRAHGHTAGAVGCLDVATGQLRWKTEASGFTGSFGWFLLGGIEVLLGYVESPTSPDKTAMVAVEAKSGNLLWKRDDFFPVPSEKRATTKPRPEKLRIGTRVTILGCQPPYALSDSTFLVAMTNYSISKHHVATGELKWTYDLPDMGSVSPESGRAPLFVSESINTVFVSYGSELMAVDLESGRPRWDVPFKFPNVVSQLELTDAGLLVRSGLSDRILEDTEFSSSELGGGDRLTLLEPKTGKPKWLEPVKKLTNPTNFVTDSAAVYVCSGRQLKRIALGDGGEMILVDSVVRTIEARPIRLTTSDSGFHLQLYARLLGFDFSGSATYDTTYIAPKSVLSEIGGAMLYLSRQVAFGSTSTLSDLRALNEPKHSGSRPHWPHDPAEHYRIVLAKLRINNEKEWTLARVNVHNGLSDAHVLVYQSAPKYLYNEDITQIWVLSEDKRSVTSFRL